MVQLVRRARARAGQWIQSRGTTCSVIADLCIRVMGDDCIVRRSPPSAIAARGASIAALQTAIASSVVPLCAQCAHELSALCHLMTPES
jgi:hypothetical protein